MEENRTIIYSIIGMLLGDGWISVSNDKRGIKRYNSGFSGDVSDLEDIKKDLTLYFGDIGKAKIRTVESYSEKYNIRGTSNSFTCNTNVTKEFIKLELPIGKRVETPFLLPSFIMNATLKEKAAFIGGLYSAEGEFPKFQKNDITPKAISFTLSKRYTLKENFIDFISQISSILNDLSINHTVKMVKTKTCDINLKATWTISNEINNYLNFIDVVDIKYCERKREEFLMIRKYLYLKKTVLFELDEAFKEVRAKKITPVDATKKYKISIHQAKNWLSKKERNSFRIPNNFIRYSDFRKIHIVH